MTYNHLLLIFLAFLATLQLAETGLVKGQGPAWRKSKNEVIAEKDKSAPKCRSCCTECFSGAAIGGSISVPDYNACQDDWFKICDSNGEFCKIDEQGKIQMLKLICQENVFFAC